MVGPIFSRSNPVDGRQVVKKMLLWLMCTLGRCQRCRFAEDERGCWGECIDCGRRHGWVSRETLRSYCRRI